jgi:murein DD-endopeptidase MepM/ murein hydrolase activator NlpD
LPNREWVKLTCTGNADKDGNLTVGIIVNAKWRQPVDFFIDGIAATSDTTVMPPPVYEPPTYTANLPVILTPSRKPQDVWRWQVWPTHFRTIWQRYGADGSEWGIDYTKYGQCYHCGVDIKSGEYGEVMAVNSGTVHTILHKNDGLGLHVTIKHTERFWTVYGHLHDVTVKTGDVVEAGQVIGHSGWTGNTRGTEQHLHIGQVDWHAGDRCCYGKYVDPLPFYSHLLDGEEPPQDGPGARYALWDYLIGDGRAYRVRGNLGGDEVFHTIQKNGRAYQVKNQQWEELWLANGMIWRGADTSPGDGRYYRVISESDPKGAPWVWAVMSEGDSCTTQKRVQYYDKATCAPDPRNSGDVTDTITLVQHYDRWQSPHGYVVPDVIALRWEEGGESYFYGRDYGLVGWGDFGGARWSAIVEDVDAGMEMERVRCL